MKPVIIGNATLYLGDCLAALKTMADSSVDSIVTDPPYGLSFMGKRWDYDVPSVEIWAECLRVLKPGGHLLAFAGTRTQHRMAVRIEDAGFEIRDMIAWVYGSGFPKSLNVAKAIESGSGRPEDIRRMQMGGDYEPSCRGRVNYDHGAGSAMDAGVAEWQPASEAARQWSGWGPALKPALEPITLARKPLVGTVAANVLAHGTGALNIDGCRVDATGDAQLAEKYASVQNAGRRENNVYGSDSRDRAGAAPHQAGRFPANLIHDGSDDVLAGFPQSSAKNGVTQGEGKGGIWSESTGKRADPTHGDAGSAARFFYCAKASKKDRGEGNSHPTVKPTDLMRYLCRLVTPHGGVVLDPFAGSGSTGKAAIIEGFRFIGIEREHEYMQIATSRIDAVQAPGDLFAHEARDAYEQTAQQADLLEGVK